MILNGRMENLKLTWHVCVHEHLFIIVQWGFQKQGGIWRSTPPMLTSIFTPLSHGLKWGTPWFGQMGWPLLAAMILWPLALLTILLVLCLPWLCTSRQVPTHYVPKRLRLPGLKRGTRPLLTIVCKLNKRHPHLRGATSVFKMMPVIFKNNNVTV